MTEIADLLLHLDPVSRVSLALAGALVLLCGAVLLLRCPSAGLVILIVAGLSVPFTVGTGTKTNINATILLIPILAALWLIDTVVLRRSAHMARSRAVLAGSLFIGVALFSFLAGQLPWVPAPPASLASQLGGLSVFGLSVLAFLLAAHQVRSVAWLSRLTGAFLILGSAYVAVRLIPGGDRLAGYILSDGATGSQFWLWLIALAFSQALLNRDLHIACRVGLWGVVLGSLYITLLSGESWLSGWVPPIVAMAMVMFAVRPLLSTALALFVGLMLVANLGAFVDHMHEEIAVSLNTRLVIWQHLIELIRLNPILGLGPANYYFYNTQSILWYERISSHNNYIDIVAQLGLVGLFCLLWFLSETAWTGWKLRRRVPAGFCRAYVYGVFGGLAGMMVSGMLGDWILPFVYNIGLRGMRSSILGWIFLGGLVALEQMLKADEVNDQATFRPAASPAARMRVGRNISNNICNTLAE